MNATTPTTFCPSCGFTAGFNARFCPNCATPLVIPGADPLLTRVRHAVAHDFEVLREIGRGGMAAVFLARELTPRRMVALKVMLPELAYSDSMPQRFLAEVQTAAMLEHPNIVTIFRTGEQGGIRYFAMRYIDGASLEQLLLVGGRLPVRLACYVLTEMARALDFAHGEGVVHRDVKPGNVMLDRRWGRAIVTDFGIAKAADGVHLTRTGLTIGTPSYMSPELCRGFAPSSATDQYALGVVAYQLLAGAPTFVGTALDVQNAHISDAPRPLRDLCPECPASLEVAVMRMLAKRPEDRWPRLADALPALLEHVGPEAACQEELRARLLRLAQGGDGPTHDRRTHDRRTHDRRTSDGDGLPPASPASAERVPAVEPLPPAAVASVDVLPRLVHLAPGQSATVRALALSTDGYVVDGQPFEWTVRDPSIAAVDQHGVVRAVAPGAVLVRARCGQVSGTTEVSVTHPASVASPVADGQPPDSAARAPSLDLTALYSPSPTPRGTATQPDAGGRGGHDVRTPAHDRAPVPPAPLAPYEAGAPKRPRWLLPAAGALTAAGLAALLVVLGPGKPGQPTAGPAPKPGVERREIADPAQRRAGAAGAPGAGAPADSAHVSAPVPVSTRIVLPVSAPRVGVLGAGDTATLTMMIAYSDRRVVRLYGGAQVRWRSSDPTVVSFDNGVAHAQRPGNATITATFGALTARRPIAVETRPGTQAAGAVVAATPKVEHPSVRDAEALADGFATRLQTGPYEDALPLSAHAPRASAQLRQQFLEWLQQGDGGSRPSVARDGDVYLDPAGNILVFRLTAHRTGRKSGDETRQVDLRAPVDHAGRWRFLDVVVTGVR